LARSRSSHACNDLIDSLRLAGGTGDSNSLVEVQSGPSANNFALSNMILLSSMLTTVPELVIEELLPPVLDVSPESDPVADSQRDLLSLEHTEFPCLVSGNRLSKDCPLFAAF
jgi:hypothetical protein